MTANENDGILDDLELELRMLPGVRAAGFDQHDDVLFVQLHLAGEPADQLEPMIGDAHRGAPRRRSGRRRGRALAHARRPAPALVPEAEPYVDLTLDVPIDVAGSKSTPTRSCRRSPKARDRCRRARRTGRGCSPCSCSRTPTSSRCTSSTTAGARSAARRRRAGSSARSKPRSTPSAGSVPPIEPRAEVGARDRQQRDGRELVAVALAQDNEVTSMHYGLAAGASAIDAAARSTLDALNRQLSRVL